ncbi:MAG: hypothetical protein Kow0040_14780 [Thermogutta sp.]
MSVRIEWHGDKLADRLEKKLGNAVKQAAVLLQNRARILANTPARRIRAKRTRDTSGGKRGSQYTLFIPSAPGRPPALRTGFGRRNITMEFHPKQLIARVGVRTNAAYMAYLELGTRKIKARPWLRPAMEQTREAIDLLIQGAIGDAAR